MYFDLAVEKPVFDLLVSLCECVASLLWVFCEVVHSVRWCWKGKRASLVFRSLNERRDLSGVRILPWTLYVTRRSALRKTLARDATYGLVRHTFNMRWNFAEMGTEHAICEKRRHERARGKARDRHNTVC